MGYYCEKSILNTCKDNREILETIYNQAFSYRQKKEVIYLPETDAGRSPFKAHQSLEKLFPDYDEGDYVYFSSIREGLNLEHNLTIHGLRHTNAALLLFAGEDIENISAHLGHASADITSRVYAHMYAEVKVRMAKTVSSALFG